jgi:ubiquinone/menaquinone biosynthesis C-methylase UbiE
MSDPAKKLDVPMSETELRSLLLQYRRENWQGIQLPETQQRLVEDILRDGGDGPLRQIAPYAEISPNSRILDLGSGVGSFVVACRRRGLQAFGIEPDRIGQGAKVTSIEIARRRLIASVFVSGVGEQLPFPDECFDAVIMNQVIEHVTDQRKVMGEAARVVRRGGVIYVACPNYLRFYEPHYKILWAPLLPKFLGRLYLRWRGRSSAMLNQLTYTTNRRLRKLFSSLGDDYVVFDLHRAQFLSKRSAGEFAAASTRLVAAITNLPLIGPLCLWMVLKYGSMAEGGCEMVIVRKPKVLAS